MCTSLPQKAGIRHSRVAQQKETELKDADHRPMLRLLDMVQYKYPGASPYSRVGQQVWGGSDQQYSL